MARTAGNNYIDPQAQTIEQRQFITMDDGEDKVCFAFGALKQTLL